MTTNRQNRPIAVFDSGLGGLTVAAAIHKLLPGEDLIFLADRARVPYAALSPMLISRFSAECFDFLWAQDPKFLVVACNTVSSVALDETVARSPVPVLGVIEPTARAAASATRSGRVGVLATKATVKRRTYEAMLGQLIPGAKVTSNGCPLLVPLIEEGWLDGDIPDRIIEHYTESVRAANVDTLVLGCTHYEYLRDSLQKIMGQSVALIDTPAVTAEEVRATLSSLDLLRTDQSAGSVRVLSTDVDENFERVVSGLFSESYRSGRVTIESAQVLPQRAIPRLTSESAHI